MVSYIEQICTSEWSEAPNQVLLQSTNKAGLPIPNASYCEPPLNRGIGLVSSQQEVQHDLVEPGRVLQLRSVAGLLHDLQPSAAVQRPEQHGNVGTGPAPIGLRKKKKGIAQRARGNRQSTSEPQTPSPTGTAGRGLPIQSTRPAQAQQSVGPLRELI